jgi:AraC-like DNA-binding protein
MVQHYSKLVREERLKKYSLPVMRAIRYLHNHIYETFTIKGLAEHLGLHANYLSALFHKEVGIPPMAYMKQLRLEEAKQLLASGENSVTEIAEMLGYSSVSYFSKDFKKVTGCSPKRYGK